MPTPEKYDVEAMMKKYPNVKSRLSSVDNPTLEELLQYGSLRQLATELVTGTLPKAYEDMVLFRIPAAAMALAISDLEKR